MPIDISICYKETCGQHRQSPLLVVGTTYPHRPHSEMNVLSINTFPTSLVSSPPTFKLSSSPFSG